MSTVSWTPENDFMVENARAVDNHVKYLDFLYCRVGVFTLAKFSSNSNALVLINYKM